MVFSDEDADYSVPLVSLSIGPFSQANRRACVNVNIIEDSIAENLESFSAMLESSSDSPGQLTINPDTTRVDIQDNDGEFGTLNLIAYFIHRIIFFVVLNKCMGRIVHNLQEYACIMQIVQSCMCIFTHYTFYIASI